MWNEREHHVWVRENIDDPKVYRFELICDDQVVLSRERNVTSRFQLQMMHEEALETAHHYMETGELPSRASRIMKR